MDDFNAVLDTIYDQYDAAFNATVAAAQAALPGLQATFDAATAAADQAWDSAMDAALAAYNSAEQGAWDTYVVAEQNAWDMYVATQPPQIQPREQKPRELPVGPYAKLTFEPFKLTTMPNGKTKVEFPTITLETDKPWGKYVPGFFIGGDTTLNPALIPQKFPFEDGTFKFGLKWKY